MIENIFFISTSIMKIIGYISLGLVCILFRIFKREWQKALTSLGIIFTWFVACGCIYPVLNDMKYPLIHFIAICIYFYVLGKRLVGGKEQ